MWSFPEANRIKAIMGRVVVDWRIYKLPGGIRGSWAVNLNQTTKTNWMRKETFLGILIMSWRGAFFISPFKLTSEEFLQSDELFVAVLNFPLHEVFLDYRQGDFTRELIKFSDSFLSSKSFSLPSTWEHFIAVFSSSFNQSLPCWLSHQS